MTANVIITTEKRMGAVLISPTSVLKRGDYAYVKVKVGNAIIEKQVTVGGYDKNGDIEIIAGLSDGELVLKNPEKIK
jgi:hypothetical protein